MAHLQKPVGDIHIHNRESESVRSLLPFQLRQTADRLIALLEDYYKYLNEKGQSTNLIDRIQFEHDVDFVGDEYLQAIKDEIAKNIPNSFVIDNRKLLRRIVDYYYTRGSDRSAETFFRIFFNDTIQIIYPRERLFKSSEGNIIDFGFRSEGVDYSFNTISEQFLDESENPVEIPTGIDVAESPERQGYLAITGDLESILFDFEYNVADTTTRNLAIEIEQIDNTLDAYVFTDGLDIDNVTAVENIYPIAIADVTLQSLAINFGSIETANSIFLAVNNPEKIVYAKSIDTGEITTLRGRQTSPYSETLELSDIQNRHIYFAEDGQMSLIANDAVNRFIPLKASGKHFCMMAPYYPNNNWPSMLVYTFYALEDAEISLWQGGVEVDITIIDPSGTNHQFDISPDASPSYFVEKRTVRANETVSFIVIPSYAASQNANGMPPIEVMYFQSTGEVVGSVYGKQTNTTLDSPTYEQPDLATYNMILSPMSNDILRRYDSTSNDNTSYSFIISTVPNEYIKNEIGFLNIVYGNVNVRWSSSEDNIYYSSTVVFPTLDGIQTQGISVDDCSDTYIIGHQLSNYSIVTPYANNTITVYYYSGGEWVVSTTHSLTYSPDRVENTISTPTNSLWKIEGTYPFALWTMDEAGDVDVQWGFNRNTYNEPAYDLYTRYGNKKGFLSDINRIHDGEYWQEFSYVVQSGFSIDQWEVAYRKLVHPAGLRLFNEVIVETLAGQVSIDEKIYDIASDDWVLNLYQPVGYHLPRYQPGQLDNLTELIQNISIEVSNDFAAFIEVDENLLSTYNLTYDTPASGLISITLDTTYVFTETPFTVNDGTTSATEIGSGTFDTRADINNPSASVSDTVSFLSWYAPISGFANDQFVNYQALDISVSDIANAELILDTPILPAIDYNGNPLQGVEFPPEDVTITI